TGLDVKKAIKTMLNEVEKRGIGERQINYRLRDAIFSRQRYWGEPFPIYYKDGVSCVLSDEELPLRLPEISDFTPTTNGEPPLSRVKNWHKTEGEPFELSTMPGFAGSSAYYLRYMDNKNEKALVSKEANEYWENVDLYVGGIEHATGHLMYSRFWNMFLYDMGYICKEEPFKKLVNQGMIQGRSSFVYRIKGSNKFVSFGLKDEYETQEIHTDVNIVRNDILDLDAFRAWRPEFADAEFILEDGKYICGYAVEKMSKSMYNVVNPDFIIEKYGADTLRMYEMFLGPLEQSKPWDTNGIDGVNKFLRRYWNLFFDRNDTFTLSEEKASKEELKVLHKTIKKVETDIENFSFNTSVSAFMICVNELSTLKCNKREILEPLTIVLSAFAPHLCEELWSLMGHKESIVCAEYPIFNEKMLVEADFEYPVSFNGKTRFKKSYPADMEASEIQKLIMEDEQTIKYLDGSPAKKIIVVKCRIINIVA
ncbi:MAG: class I tRNA ligase family protein, partial [Rikenellaceae bacterium]